MKRVTSDTRGMQLVEFALVLPLLLLLVFGIVEFGCILYDQAVITNASREAARLGVESRIPRWPAQDIETEATNYCSNHLINFQAASIRFDPPPTACTQFGDYLTVTVDYTYQFLVLPNIDGLLSNLINLSATTTMRCE